MGNSARIRRSRSVTCAVSRFSRSSTPSTNATPQSTSNGTVRPGDRSATTSENAAVTPNATRPHSTCSTRKSWTVIGEAARSRRRLIDAFPPSTRSRERAAEESSGPKSAPAAPDRSPVDRTDGLRKIADVGQHAYGELRSSQVDEPADDHRQAEPDARTEHRPPGRGRHDSTRRSSGSRPIRTMAR